MVRHRRENVEEIIADIAVDPTNTDRFKTLAAKYGLSVQAIYLWRRLYYEETWVLRKKPLSWDELRVLKKKL